MHVCYFFLQLPTHESWIDYHWTPGSVIFFLSGMLTIRRVWGSLEVQSLWSVHSNQAGTGRLWHAYAKQGHFSRSLSLAFPEKGVHSFSLLVALVSSLLTPKTQIEAPEGDNFLTQDFHYRTLWEQLTTLCKVSYFLLSLAFFSWVLLHGKAMRG